MKTLYFGALGIRIHCENLSVITNLTNFSGHIMTMFRLPHKLFIFFIIPILFITGCSKIIAPGVPAFESRYAKKVARPVPGKDFKLIPISSHVIATQKRYTSKSIRRTGRRAGIGGYQYRIGPQDILTITVWDHPELTIPAGEFRSPTAAGHKVGEDGFFFFPYAGRVKAAGRTTEQIRKDLEQRLAKFITKPQVGVAIAAYRSQQAYVSGEVGKPGVLPINDIPLTIRDAIAKAGGLSEKASDYALLTHHKQKINIDLDKLFRGGDNTQNYVLRGGDSLYIAEKNGADKIFVMGEVKKAGSIPFSRFGLSLAEALSDANGINEEKANPTGIFVVRQENPNDKKPTVYQLQMTAVHSMLLAEQFALRPRDIVYVTAAPVTRWNRVISQLLPSFTVISASKNIAK